MNNLEIKLDKYIETNEIKNAYFEKNLEKMDARLEKMDAKIEKMDEKLEQHSKEHDRKLELIRKESREDRNAFRSDIKWTFGLGFTVFGVLMGALNIYLRFM